MPLLLATFVLNNESVNCFMTVQREHDELKEKFLEERAALEAKYQLLYQPLYTKVS